MKNSLFSSRQFFISNLEVLIFIHSQAGNFYIFRNGLLFRKYITPIFPKFFREQVE